MTKLDGFQTTVILLTTLPVTYCHMVPMVLAGTPPVTALSWEPEVRCSLRRDGFTKPGAWLCLGDWVVLSPAGETLWHGGSWKENWSRKHRASSTTFCCQSKSQGHPDSEGEKNKLPCLGGRKQNAAQPRRAADGPISADFLSKLNVNPMNYVHVNDTLDTEMLPSWFFFFFKSWGQWG